MAADLDEPEPEPAPDYDDGNDDDEHLTFVRALCGPGAQAVQRLTLLAVNEHYRHVYRVDRAPRKSALHEDS